MNELPNEPSETEWRKATIEKSINDSFELIAALDDDTDQDLTLVETIALAQAKAALAQAIALAEILRIVSGQSE